MRTNRWKFARLAIPVALLVTAVVAAQAQSPSTIARNFDQVAISPDGSRIAWVVQSPLNESGESAGGSAIYVQELRSPGAKPKRVSASNDNQAASEDTIAWSPDSKHLAFLSDLEGDGQSNFYVANVEAGGVRKLTNLKGYLADPAWSPDEKTLAFLFTENAPRAAGPLMPMVPETGVIDQKIYEQRLTLVDLGSGKVRQLSPPDMYVYQYDWSPNGKDFRRDCSARLRGFQLVRSRNLYAERGKRRTQAGVQAFSADRGAALVSRWQDYRVYRRADERRRINRRRRLYRFGDRRRCSQRHARNWGIAVVALLGIAGQNSSYGKYRWSDGSFRG